VRLRGKGRREKRRQQREEEEEEGADRWSIIG
jgi:hypothetical protein